MRRHAQRRRGRQSARAGPIMKPRNLLFIMSDEHSKRVLGCHGHPMIRTPNLDRLAASRRALHRCLLQLADLRALARELPDRPLRARHPLLGQRHRLRRQRPVLGAPAEGRGPSRRFDRQAALPQRRGRQRLHQGAHAAARGRGHRRPDRHAARSAAAAQSRAEARGRRRLRRLHLPGLRRPHHRGRRGLAARARHKPRTRSPGCCSSPWSARTSR